MQLNRNPYIWSLFAMYSTLRAICGSRAFLLVQCRISPRPLSPKDLMNLNEWIWINSQQEAYLVNCGIQIDQGFDVTPLGRHEVFGSIYATLDSTTSQELSLIYVFPLLKTYETIGIPSILDYIIREDSHFLFRFGYTFWFVNWYVCGKKCL